MGQTGQIGTNPKQYHRGVGGKTKDIYCHCKLFVNCKTPKQNIGTNLGQIWDKWDKLGQLGQMGQSWDKWDKFGTNWDKWDNLGQTGTKPRRAQTFSLTPTIDFHDKNFHEYSEYRVLLSSVPPSASAEVPATEIGMTETTLDAETFIARR